MGKTILVIAIIFFLILVVFQLTYRSKPVNNYCLKIDTLIQGGFNINRIIPELENASGIEATCNKGTFGHIYFDTLTFNNDIKRWKKYFKCR
jgi:hypothetical protein